MIFDLKIVSSLGESVHSFESPFPPSEEQIAGLISDLKIPHDPDTLQVSVEQATVIKPVSIVESPVEVTPAPVVEQLPE